MRIILLLSLFINCFSLSAQEGLVTTAQIDTYVAQFIDAKITHTYCQEENEWGNLAYQSIDSNLIWFQDSWGEGEGGNFCKMALKNGKLVYYNYIKGGESGLHEYILYYGKTGMLIDAVHKSTVTNFSDNSISTKTNLESISAEDVKKHLKRYNDYHAMWEQNDYTNLTCGHE